MAASWIVFVILAILLGGVLSGVVGWTASVLFRRDKGDGS